MKLRAPARLRPGVSATMRLCFRPCPRAVRFLGADGGPSGVAVAADVAVGSLPRTARIWNV